MKNFIIIFAVVVISILTFTFGRVTKEVVDDVNIVSAIGIDKEKGDKIKGTVVMPTFLADKSIENEIFEGESFLAKEVINNLQNQSADPLVIGGLTVALYGEEVAREGITEYADALRRDASIGSGVYLGVVDGEAAEIMKGSLGNRGTGRHLATLFEHNMKHRDLPKMNLHLFMFRFYTKGMDTFLPYVKMVNEKVEIKGIALFKEEKMVDIVNETDMFFFKGMVENFIEGTYTVRIEEIDEYASIKRIVSKRDIRVQEVNGKPEVSIHIYLQGVLSEFSGRSTDEKIVANIVKGMEDEIVKRSDKLIKKFQEKNIDPVGFGYLASTSQRNFDAAKWKATYQDMKINVTSKVDLIQTGVIE